VSTYDPQKGVNVRSASNHFDAAQKYNTDRFTLELNSIQKFPAFKDGKLIGMTSA